MDNEYLKELLKNVKSGQIEIDEAMSQLKILPFEDIGFAKIDHHRNIRNGYPEVIYSEGKTKEQINEIFKRLLTKNKNIMATRASIQVYESLQEICEDVIYYEQARIVALKRNNKLNSEKVIGIVTAGTSDIPVAEEAAVTAEILGNKVTRIYDVGVAGIHRLFAHADELNETNVLIVVAGMEGALASVVGGMVDKPVVAVPTSVGYGANFGGLAALLTMLNSCASGISVVNIDNGFGAAYFASMVNNLK